MTKSFSSHNRSKLFLLNLHESTDNSSVFEPEEVIKAVESGTKEVAIEAPETKNQWLLKVLWRIYFKPMELDQSAKTQDDNADDWSI